MAKSAFWLYLSLRTFRGKIVLGSTFLGVLTLAFFIFYLLYIEAQLITPYQHIVNNTVPTQYYCKVVEDCINSSTSATAVYLSTGEESYRAEREAIWKECEQALEMLGNYTNTWQDETIVSLLYNVKTKANRLRKEQEHVEQLYFAKRLNLKEEVRDERIRQIDQLKMLAADARAELELIINIQKQEIARTRATIDFSLFQLKYIYTTILTSLMAAACVFVAYQINHALLSRLRRLKLQLREYTKGAIPAPIPIEQADEITPIEMATNHLNQDLRSIKEFAQKVGEEKYDTQLTAFNQSGEIGSALMQMRDSLRIVAEKEDKISWGIAGEARFAQILRINTQNIEELCDVFLKELVAYLKAAQASIFIYYPKSNAYQQDTLEVKAWYAYDTKRYKMRQIAVGEGILGEAFRENRLLYLDRVPEGYLEIVSGLGDSKPHSLLIVPICIGNQKEGVLELATLHKMQAHEIGFVEKVMESLASAIIAVRTNEKTRKLLEESQQQAEALRAQEEEMRQNLEEMQATQEEMQRKERAIKKMLDEAAENEHKLRVCFQQLEEARRALEEKNREIELLREEEKNRTETQLKAHKALLERLKKRYDEQEAQAQARIAALEREISELRKS